MGRSLGLALYLLLARGGPGGRPPRGPGRALAPPRPEGPLAWLDVAGPEALAAAARLGLELRRLRREARLLVTLPAPPAGAPADLLLAPTPAEARGAVRAFLGHWRPDVAVFMGGRLPPALICAAHARGIPLLLVNGRVPLMPDNPWRRAPGLMASVLGRFRRILMTDATGARYARRAGAPAEAVEAAGWLDDGPDPPGVAEAERLALAAAIGTRPVWLAAGVTPAEEEAVLAAHRDALGRTHRLLLILVPSEPERGAAIAARAAELFDGAVALRSAEQHPAEMDALYVADTDGEWGLWHRLAPVCFLGGTLAGPGPTRPPAEPALLGAAILHGPAAGGPEGLLARLGAAGAARRVGDAAALGEAVAEMSAPDRAAAAALAAWTHATAGGAVTQRVARLIADALPPRPAPAKG